MAQHERSGETPPAQARSSAVVTPPAIAVDDTEAAEQATHSLTPNKRSRRRTDQPPAAGFEPGDNVVEVLVMGALVPEAVEASWALLERDQQGGFRLQTLFVRRDPAPDASESAADTTLYCRARARSSIAIRRRISVPNPRSASGPVIGAHVGPGLLGVGSVPVTALGEALTRDDSDAVQAAAYLPADVQVLGVDMLSLGAHKFYGPKGVGALYVRRAGARLRLEPQIDGGGQEWALRSGTLNVPGIVGFARALDLCQAEMNVESQRLARLRQRLWDAFQREIPDVQRNGPDWETPGFRLPGNLNVSFPFVDGEERLHLGASPRATNSERS